MYFPIFMVTLYKKPFNFAVVITGRLHIKKTVS